MPRKQLSAYLSLNTLCVCLSSKLMYRSSVYRITFILNLYYNTKIKDIFHIHKDFGTILNVECCNRLYRLLNENFQFIFRENRRKLNFMQKVVV